MDWGVVAPARSFGETGHLLGPYVPSLIVDWLRDRPEQRYQSIDCTLVFADVSGFTRMTEMLAGRGKAGAEEMAGFINGTFEPLLQAAYAHGSGLIKWGGDATLLLFRGPDHARRACRAACEMQRVMRAVGRVQTSRGSLRLRMSIGVSSGSCDFLLVGHADHRELLVLGPVTSVLTQMEKVAEAGQIVISDATASALEQAGERRPGVRVGDGWLLRHPPSVTAESPASNTVDYREVEIGPAISRTLREEILGGGLEREHRHASIGFLKFTGTDRLLAEEGPEALVVAVDHVIRAVQSATLDAGVAFLATDIGPDCGKVMMSAGAPRHIGRDESRMAAALRAAIDAAGVLPVSAGATAGRAFSGDYGPPYRRTYSLMGDCVNLAARLMAHAGDGELLASDRFVKALDGSFVADPRPPFAAKGKRAPVHPFSLGSPARAHVSPAVDRPALIGREPELAVLLDAVAAAERGSGRVIELVGEPGMGKSSLLAELEARVDAPVLWTDGEVYGATRSYAPFERLMRGVCAVAPTAPASELATRLRALTRERVPALLPWLPLIGIAAGLELPSTRVVDQTEPSLRKERLEELTSEFLAAILPGPTVLILNDVHLMDDASRDLIRRLAADAQPRPWLVIVSRRGDTEGPLEDGIAERLELGPLSQAAAAELLALATAAAPLPPHRLATLAERAAGNPLFLRELSAQLREGGDGDLPSSVEEAIAARIDRLDTSARRILRGAAVLGMDIEVPLLEEVLQPELSRLPGGRLDLDGLEEFLEPIAPARRRFSHQLVREVAYEALPYGRRSDLHARTAFAIQRVAGEHAEDQAELLSLHLFHGAQYEPAWRYSRLAAERARSRYANAEAVAFYDRALEAAARVPGLAREALAGVDGAIGDLCVELGEMAAADTALLRGLRRVREQPVAAARFQLQLARLRDVCGQHRAAREWTARAERTLGALDTPESWGIRAQLAARRARIEYRRGRHEDALIFAEMAVALARQTGDLMTLAEALEYADLSAVELGRPAGEGAQQALAIYEELGALGDEARVRNTLGLLAYHRGAWSEALEHYRAAESAYMRSGKRWDAATAAANSAEILADQGRLDEAEAGLERSMLIWRGSGAASEVAFGDYQLGRIAARLGRGEEAESRLGSSREHFSASGELTEVVVVDALTAESRLLAGDHPGALALAEETLRRAASLGGVATVTPLLQRVRGASLLASGALAEAEHAFRTGLEAARRRSAGHEIAFTLSALLEAGLSREPAEEREWREELAVLAGALGLNFG